MANIRDVSLKVKNYKSFNNQAQGFESILPINLIIGKNNAGKSALLDTISHLVAKQNIMRGLYNEERAPEIITTHDVKENDIREAFPQGTSGGVIPGDHYEFGKKWINSKITVSTPFDIDRPSFIDINPSFPQEIVELNKAQELAQIVNTNFSHYEVRRIFADRDIRPEKSDGPNLSPDGTGATNMIRYCLQDADANATHYIKKDMLAALNYIFDGETRFTDISTKIRNDFWEIYLIEDSKGTEVPLSYSGSGLKTIILVLLQLLVIPKIIHQKEKNFIFLFEEIENNLHPGLLRNLLEFIRNFAEKHDSTFFLTTHSSVAIDIFDKDPRAQIIHVKHNKKSSKVSSIKQYTEKKSILADIDVRASDLLQSNAIIWVEGPSDRIYINHWISLYSNGEIQEGKHYQCVFYGGKLLARLTAKPDTNDEVNILSVNNNPILVVDSDITTPVGDINNTKKRMIEEIKDVNGVTWITDGKEIENYLPKTLLETYFDSTTESAFTKRTKIPDFIDKLVENAGSDFIQHKALYADYFTQLYTKEMLDSDIDLSTHIQEICEKLEKWNGIK